jgi:ribonuclease P protein subunit RPR2
LLILIGTSKDEGVTATASMAKSKTPKSGSGIPQKHLHSRISYLKQAAIYLAFAQQIKSERPKIPANHPARRSHSAPSQEGSQSMYAQSRNLLSQLRAVSLKSQIRLASDLKHSFCRRCATPLLPGVSTRTSITNRSHRGEKPWADVLVITCGFCGATRRFPIGQKARLEETQAPAGVGVEPAGRGDN